jgi:ribosome-binding factor A
MDAHRRQRVAETLREEIEELINYELGDPRVHTALVAEVIVTPDLRRAQVRLALAGDAAEQRETLRVLEGARQFLRHALRDRLEMYRIPDLHFEAAVEAATNVGRLLKRMRRGRPRDVQPPAEGSRQ